jgi:hypothetical protein
MLINEIKPLGTDVQLESDLLERALETGVIVEYKPVIDEDRVDTMLGGLIRTEEHVHAREANLTATSPASARGTAKAPRRSPYGPRRSGGRGRPK